MSSKLESDVCCRLQVAPSGESYEGKPGLAESNGRLLLGIWRDSLHVTCGLTACTAGSAPGPALGNEYGKTLPFTTPVTTLLLSSGGRGGAETDRLRLGLEPRATAASRPLVLGGATPPPVELSCDRFTAGFEPRTPTSRFSD